MTMTREEKLQQFAEQTTKGLYLDRHNLIQMVKQGAEWADQHPQWIPVEERLPEVDDCGNSDFYLVHDFGESDHVAYYCKTDNEWYTENGESVFSTHWMEIVPPRKEE